MNRTLILGLGNTILSDDAAGIIVARRLYEKLIACGGRNDVDLAEASYAGWRLIDLMAGYRRIIIIDSILSGKGSPGECFKVEPREISSLHLQSSHGLGLEEALELARRSGQDVPEKIAIFAIEVTNPYEFGEGVSPEIAGKIPGIVDGILDEEKLLTNA